MQQYVAQRAAEYLSRELQAQVSIEGFYIKPFTSLQLNGLFISDQQADTLLYASEMQAAFDLGLLLQRQITLETVSLSNAVINLHTDSQGGKNVDYLVDYFSRPTSDRSKNVHLDLHTVNLTNIRFNHLDERLGMDENGDKVVFVWDSTRPQLNFKDIAISSFSGTFTDIDFSSEQTGLQISGLTLQEKSGFQIQNLSTRATINNHQIELRDLDLRTNRSHLKHYILLSYQDFSDFDDFIHQVRLQLELNDARVSSADIAFFAPNLYDIVFDAGISGSLSGTVPEITGDNIKLQATPQTSFQGNLSITGLPLIEQTIFEVDIDQLKSQSQDIEQMVVDLSPRLTFDLPDFLNNLGNLSLNGAFYGHYNDFRISGMLSTAIGNLDTDLAVVLEDQGTRYQGDLLSQQFNLGALVAADNLGQISFSAYVDGVDFEPASRELWLDAQVEQLDFNNYSYTGLSTSLSLMQNELSGQVTVRDPNLRMDVQGTSSIHPDSILHSLYADVFLADLYRLGLYERDSIVIHAATIRSDLDGQNINDIAGQLQLRNLLFSLREERHHVAQAHLDLSGPEDQRLINLQSSAADLTLRGSIDIPSFPSSLQKSVAQHLPALVGNIEEQTGTQDFLMDLHIKDFDAIAALISPALGVSDSSFLSAHFNSDSLANLELTMPWFRWGSTDAQNLSISLSSQEEVAELMLNAQNLELYGRTALERLQIQQHIQNDQVNYHVRMADEDDGNHAALSGRLNFYPENLLLVNLDSSKLMLYGDTWEVGESGAIIQDNRASIQPITIQNDQQRIQISGVVSAQVQDQLKLNFEQFELGTINSFISQGKLNISGLLNGEAHIRSLLNRPYAEARLDITQTKMDETELGSLALQADFEQENNQVNLTISQHKDLKEQLFIEGRYHLDREENSLDLQAQFDDTEMEFLGVILKDLISDVKGQITGQARITGTPLQLIINGEGELHDAAFTVDYLQTPYLASGPIKMENTVFKLDQLALFDPQGHQAQVSGEIDMRRPTNPEINAIVEATNFLVLRTSAEDNPLYFGTAYGTGRFQFQGRTDAMSIQINARTDENTVFNIPLNSLSTLGDYEFIRFTSFSEPEATALESSRAPANLSGLRMNIDLQVTPAALTNIYTDLGELSGRGEGQITLGISSLGDFEMFGDYLINSGKFTFSAQDFINKIFEIKQGGNIRWTGKPIEAAIDLTAYYEQRTSLSPLYDAAGRTANEQRVTARAEMELSGQLTRPLINFALEFPADPYVKDELQSYLSDANNVNQQALSLIVRRSFIPGSTSDLSRELNSTLLSAGTEIAFNQLNTIISQSLNLNFIDLNIRSLNDASASLRFFNDRLVFTGGITDLRNQRLNDLNVFSNERIATDAELLYLIRKDGRLVLRGSNRLNTRHFLLNPSDEYISALGLIYRREFDNFGEFFKKKEEQP